MKDNLQSEVLSHAKYWAIEPGAAEMLVAQLGLVNPAVHRENYEAIKASGGQAEDVQASRIVGDYRESKPYKMYGSTAIISVSGPMTKKGSSFGTGGTIDTRDLVRKATSDGDVKSILMIWDSPGGSVSGTELLANDIAMASKKKEVISFIDDMCCSAALWCAVQANSVYANATAMIGSIGVFSYAIDMSKYAENLGIKVHLLSTGKYKGAGAIDGVPIDEDQLAEMQQTVDVYGDHFISALATGRNMTRAAAEELADGRTWIGKAAQSIGLIDGISTIDDILVSLQQAKGKSKAVAAEGQNDFVSEQSPLAGETLEQTLDSVLAAVERGNTRANSVRNMRAKEGRLLGADRVRQLRTAHAELGDLIELCNGLNLTSEESTSEPATAPESSPATASHEQNAEMDELREALASSRQAVA